MGHSDLLWCLLPMWLQYFAFQCLVDKHCVQSHTGVGCCLPKGRYCFNLVQNIRFEWGPRQMVHLCLGLIPVALSSVLACLFVFWSSTLSSLSSLLLIASDSLDHTCSNRCMSLWTMSGSWSGLFVAWDFLGICWVFLGGFWGFMLNHPGGKEILYWLDILTGLTD